MLLLLFVGAALCCRSSHSSPIIGNTNDTIPHREDLGMDVWTAISRLQVMTTNLSTAYERITNLEQNYSTLKTKYTRDVKNLANVVTGTAFSSCKGDPTITLTGTKIKYPASGSYHGNENCEWTIDAGSVTLSFSHFDMELCRGSWCDYITILKDGTQIDKWDQQTQSAHPYSRTVDGKIIIKFHSDPNIQGTGFELHISNVE